MLRAEMWPDGKSFAVAFTLDFDAEEVWVSEDPANASRPATLSQGTYGGKVAVPALLELLARHGVRATWFVPGRVAETWPDRVREIVAAGHELACHGYTHRGPATLPVGEQLAEMSRARAALDGFGVPVVGYRAPGWDLATATLEHAARNGFTYSSNLMDDVRPYVGPEGLVELPVSWILDDAPHFWFDAGSWNKTIRSAAEVRALWQEEILGIRRMGALAVLTFHPQVIGRPGRLAMLDELVGWILGMDDVWVATCAEIAERWSRGALSFPAP